MRDDDGRDDEGAGVTPGPLGFRKASKPVVQTHVRASPIPKVSEKQTGAGHNVST